MKDCLYVFLVKQVINNTTLFPTYRGVTEELQRSYRGVIGVILAYSSLTTSLKVHQAFIFPSVVLYFDLKMRSIRTFY